MSHVEMQACSGCTFSHIFSLLRHGRARFLERRTRTPVLHQGAAYGQLTERLNIVAFVTKTFSRKADILHKHQPAQVKKHIYERRAVDDATLHYLLCPGLPAYRRSHAVHGAHSTHRTSTYPESSIARSGQVLHAGSNISVTCK